MFRVLTLAREFGSGGAAIARIVAERLAWRLLDSSLITEIGRKVEIDPEVLRQFDECVDPWLYRLVRRSLMHGGFEGAAFVPPTELLNAETMARLTHALIREAHEIGNCVIVGRGGQCVLQQQPDVFHAFVYAPWSEKVARIHRRYAEGADAEELIRATDARRSEYVHVNFQCSWKDPHLYHLLVSSSLGEQAAASLIVSALSSEPGQGA